MVIWITSVLIIIFMSVSVSSVFRHKIRQFIGDNTSQYYLQTINISNTDSINVEIITHSIVKLNDHFFGHSKEANGLILIDAEIDLNPYTNRYTKNCSSCHEAI